MSDLGLYLKQLRQQRDRSRRWVERQSRQRYSAERERQISHSYLRQLEEGVRERPNPLKLQTLAEIYEVDYEQLLARAGYLEPAGSRRSLAAVLPATQPSVSAELLTEVTRCLDEHGVHPEYFLRSLTGLSRNSLALVSRLVTTLSIQESQPRRAGQQEPATGHLRPHRSPG